MPKFCNTIGAAFAAVTSIAASRCAYFRIFDSPRIFTTKTGKNRQGTVGGEERGEVTLPSLLYMAVS